MGLDLAECRRGLTYRGALQFVGDNPAAGLGADLVAEQKVN